MKNTVKAPQFGINLTPDVAQDQKIDTPTVKYRDKTGWIICNTSLGCGSRILQGWSSGIGVDASNQKLFERKLFELAYLSINTQYVTDHWYSYGTGHSVEAPIGVSMHRYQFLESGRSYTINSTSDWITRFETFVTKHALGVFTKSHEWKNPDYHKGNNVTALWTWNGSVPKAADVGIIDWKLPE